jgi:hypothetical protein
LVEKSVKNYIEDLDKAVNENREKHGQEPLNDKTHKSEIKETKVSATDPESGYMVRDNKPKGFFYLKYRTVDSKNNIITDVHVTADNVNDVDSYLERIDRQIERFGFNIKYFERWAEIFQDTVMTAAMVDRLTHRQID